MLSIGRKGRDPRNKTIALNNGLILRLSYDGADEVLDKMFKEITAELLEKNKQVEKLIALYDKEIAEHQARTAEHKARTAEHQRRTAENEKKAAEHEAKAAQNEILAAQIVAKTEEYKAMSLKYAKKTAENKEKITQLEEVLTVASKLGTLADVGTDLVKKLTPLQIEFQTQVNQRAELTNEIAAKIKICSGLLSENKHYKLEKKVALLEKAFAKLAQSVETENNAQDAVIDALEQLEAVVNQMESTLGTIKHQQSYYSILKEKSYNMESDYLEKENTILDANRPTKEKSDELGRQCEEAFFLIKQRLKQQKGKEAEETESLSSSRTSISPITTEDKYSPPSKSRSVKDDGGRSSPSSSSQSGSDDDDEAKQAVRKTRSLTTSSQLSMRLQSTTESQSRSPSPQQRPSQPPSPTWQRPETSDVSVALLGINKPRPLTPPLGEEGSDPARKNNNRITITGY